MTIIRAMLSGSHQTIRCLYYYTVTRSQKAHGCDDLSINVIKIWDTEIVKPSYLIYMKCLETGRFPPNWKKANVLPIHKKKTGS